MTGQLPPAAPLLLTAAAASWRLPACTAGLRRLRRGSLWGSPSRQHPLPITSVAGGPGRLSILYENQAMRMERAELKSELKLISARVSAVLRGQYLVKYYMWPAQACHHCMPSALQA